MLSCHIIVKDVNLGILAFVKSFANINNDLGPFTIIVRLVLLMSPFLKVNNEAILLII